MIFWGEVRNVQGGCEEKNKRRRPLTLTPFPRRFGPPHRRQHVGLHQLVRRVPDVLRHAAGGAVGVGHLVDRVAAGVPDLLRGRRGGAAHGRGLLPAAAAAGHAAPRARPRPRLPRHAVLAPRPRPGPRHGPRRRLSLHPHRRHRLHLLRPPPLPRPRSRRLGLRHRRPRLSRHGEAAVAPGRLCLCVLTSSPFLAPSLFHFSSFAYCFFFSFCPAGEFLGSCCI